MNIKPEYSTGAEWTVDEKMMEAALALAAEAAAEGEVPVGCVIALGDCIVGRGRNRRGAAQRKRRASAWERR